MAKKATTTYRRGIPGARYARQDAVSQTLVKLRADDKGVIPIKTEPEARVADAIGLRVTRLPSATTAEVRDLQSKETD